VGVGHIVVALNKADAADPEIADWPGPRLRGEISGECFPSYPPKELPADPGTPTDALIGQSRRPADPRPEAGTDSRVSAPREGRAGLTELSFPGRSLSETQKGGQ
jgi:hypothetical protein